MKTAQEILTDAGLSDTHWGLRIIEAEARGEFTDDDLRDASSWVTCACGRLDERVPRNDYDAPRDRELKDLGVLFVSPVFRGDFIDAADCLVEIERRAGELLAKIEGVENAKSA